MRLVFSKNIYPKTALIKAAYMFTDRAYIHLDSNEISYFVEIEMKDNYKEMSIKEFENELISQTARYVIAKRTKTLREIMFARAVASTVLMDDNYIDDSYDDEEVTDVDSILVDWFDKNENS